MIVDASTVTAISSCGRRIVKMNDDLEKRLFIERTYPLECKNEIISLLDLVKAESSERALTIEQADIFRFWKHFLMSRLSYVYFDDITTG